MQPKHSKIYYSPVINCSNMITSTSRDEIIISEKNKLSAESSY